MLLISIVTSCLNEEGNVEELHRRIKAQFDGQSEYDFEHIYVDNGSTDGTVAEVKRLAAADPRVKLIVNARNFGHIRSPLHGMYQAQGAAIIAMASDLQDPPELIRQFLQRWREGHLIVVGVKPSSRETWAMAVLRRLYYRVLGRMSDIKLIPNFTGFGLYDRSVVQIVRELGDPYPYFRGLISDLGIGYATVEFEQARRKRGITKNNFYTLYDLAMLGVTSHSKMPLRLATMAGFLLSTLSLMVSLGYLVAKLVWWDQFALGTAPLVIGLFFFGAVQLLFIGILGEYVSAIHTQVVRRPLVIERERVNLPAASSLPSHSAQPAMRMGDE
ncbi:glycosyltransferase family 2 protein [Inhella sp.]|uniref:glycosyltransferase family 2 protein n=1 Tax=Inhella sp. TaxID=1921806 RepID=UPI0035B48653